MGSGRKGWYRLEQRKEEKLPRLHEREVGLCARRNMVQDVPRDGREGADSNVAADLDGPTLAGLV